MSEPLLRQGATGHAVVVLQTYLDLHGAHLAKDGVFGPLTEAAVKHFQAEEKITIDGIVGPVTWARLGVVVDPEPAYSEPADWALWYWRHQLVHHDMDYAEVRPMHLVRPPAVPREMDCSTFATLCYWDAHRPDPNDLHYDGAGNTSSLLDHGLAVKLLDVRESDLVFYSNPEHVTVYVGAGVVVSMGQQGDPRKLPVAYRPVTAVRSY
jgi:hypothetical protein